MPPFVMSRPPLEAIKAVLCGQDGDSIKWPDTDGNFIGSGRDFFVDGLAKRVYHSQ